CITSSRVISPFSINSFSSASVCARLETISSSSVTGLLSGCAIVLPHLITLSARHGGREYYLLAIPTSFCASPRIEKSSTSNSELSFRMIHQIFLNDLWLEGKHIRIIGVRDNPNPMNIRGAKRFNPGKILNYSTGFRTKQRLVDTKDVAISVNEDYRFGEGKNLSLKGGEEFIVSGFCFFLGRLDRRIQHISPEAHFRPVVLKPRVCLCNDHDGFTPVPPGQIEAIAHPDQISSIPLGILSIHLACAPEVIVTAHHM